MKRAVLIFCILTLTIHSSCIQKKPKDELADELKESGTFKNYIQYSTHLTEGLKSNQYNKSNVDKKYLLSHGVNNLHDLPKEDLYKIYTNANMRNAKDYIDTQLKIDSTYKKLEKEFPALADMEELEKLNFLVAVRKEMMQ